MNLIIVKSRTNHKFNQTNSLKIAKIFNKKSIILKKSGGHHNHL
jgi:hypothetical protein